MTQTKKICHTPTPGKSGTTSIPLWKYTCVRRAILTSLKAAGSEGLLFGNLAEAARQHLSDDELSRLGSVKWHVTTVKLNMEVEGEIIRAKVSGPQRIIVAP